MKIKKNIKTGIALALCGALSLGAAGTAGYALAKDKSNEQSADKTEAKEVSSVTATDEVEDEAVYVLANADGSVQKIIVSDWLKDAQGEDAYTQEEVEKELPVKMSIRYTMDGKEVSAQEIAGKSGHVTMRFDYENLQTEEVSVNGKKENLFVPFTMLTGMLLESEKFQNVTVSNGKIIDDGEHTAVVGFAFPGLQENLDISKADLEIPDYVEISADVTEFELSTTMTLATTEVFEKLDPDKLDTGKLSDAADQMMTALDQLLDGSSQLYDGMNTLLEKSGTLVSGVNQLAVGANKLQSGAQSLDGGAAELASGAKQLADGLAELDANSDSLRSGAKQVFQSLLSMADSQLAAAGLSVPTLTIGNYEKTLSGVIASLDDTAVYQKVEQQVKEKVEANRDAIREGVTDVVTEQVSAQVNAKVTASVRESVSAQVRENESQFRAAVVESALGFTLNQYQAAVEAGSITKEQQESVEAAVESAMQAQIDATMQSDEVQSQINTLTAQNTEAQMATDEVKKTIEDNTDLQVQKIVSETMASEEVQSQLKAAAEGAQQVIGLKASLDSYNAFYLGVIAYTSGVSDAATGASDLKNGADALKSGTAELYAGSGKLAKGIQTMKDSTPALLDGITQLKDGSMQLSDGLKQFKEEGIQKLADVVNGDLEGLTERLRGTVDAAKSYKTFSGNGENKDGNVTFLYKTDAIKVEE